MKTKKKKKNQMKKRWIANTKRSPETKQCIAHVHSKKGYKKTKSKEHSNKKQNNKITNTDGSTNQTKSTPHADTPKQ